MAPKIEIKRITVGTSYPRNGNHHKGTTYYRFETWIDGKLQGCSHLKREAVQFGNDIVNGVYDD